MNFKHLKLEFQLTESKDHFSILRKCQQEESK